jgi:DNA glycosylase AlkZ-like
MTDLHIAYQRLSNQHLLSPVFKKPTELVQWLGAVQAQDYYGAKWALGQRLNNATDAEIEKAFSEGTILRTHVMRPTWHFVAREDIRWLLRLTAPRVHAANAYYYRKLELDADVFKRANKALTRSLQGGKQLTRDKLHEVLQQAKLTTSDRLRFNYILIRAELDGVICSGARQGKQMTYALLDERAPDARPLERDEALAKLTLRYFTSHGPATELDFGWWSGLASADIKLGLHLVQGRLVKEVINNKPYWLSASNSVAKRRARCAFLLPAYDEYLIAYKDRSAALGSATRPESSADNPIFSSPIVIDGSVVGSWQSVPQKNSVRLTLRPFKTFNASDRQAMSVAVRRYSEFLQKPVAISRQQ